MQEAVQNAVADIDVPQWLNWLLWGTVILAAVWLLAQIFIAMRRSATNLTPVNAPDAKKSAQPDFLKVDHKAREEAIKRGEAYDKELTAREAAEAAAAGTTKQVKTVSRLASLATLLFSVFSLVGTGVSVIWQVDRMGQTLTQADKLGMMIQKYPIPFAVCLFVIGYYVVIFFVKKQWKSPAS
jgi:hypothetical protein